MFLKKKNKREKESEREKHVIRASPSVVAQRTTCTAITRLQFRALLRFSRILTLNPLNLIRTVPDLLVAVLTIA